MKCAHLISAVSHDARALGRRCVIHGRKVLAHSALEACVCDVQLSSDTCCLDHMARDGVQHSGEAGTDRAYLVHS